MFERHPFINVKQENVKRLKISITYKHLQANVVRKIIRTKTKEINQFNSK